ncbi:MAG: TolC family protein [Polyangiaceae bacterium]
MNMVCGHLLSRCFKTVLCGALGLSSATAHALQPIEYFYEGARVHSFDAREQLAASEQRDWEADAALGRLLPSFTARATYQRNQFETAVTLPGTTTSLVITPKNQWDGLLQIDVPIIDLASYHRHAQSKRLAEAAKVQSEVVGADVTRAVARAYYSFVGASALAVSARHSLQMAEDNLAFVSVRHDVGAALELDVERARANVERAKQDVADAGLVQLTAARNLETLSGASPAPVNDFVEDDLHAEGELQGWLDGKSTPVQRVERLQNEAALSGDRAAKSVLLPTLSANAQERFTNATGFSGRSSIFTVQAVLQWKLDYSSYATSKAQSLANQVQQIRGERSRRSEQDAIFDAYQRVATGLLKSAAARAQAGAADKAAELASDRYRAGVLTQLDVTQSQRDAFQAQASRIQADADLAYARVVLRSAAGKPPLAPVKAQ